MLYRLYGFQSGALRRPQLSDVEQYSVLAPIPLGPSTAKHWAANWSPSGGPYRFEHAHQKGRHLCGHSGLALPQSPRRPGAPAGLVLSFVAARLSILRLVAKVPDFLFHASFLGSKLSCDNLAAAYTNAPPLQNPTLSYLKLRRPVQTCPDCDDCDRLRRHSWIIVSRSNSKKKKGLGIK